MSISPQKFRSETYRTKQKKKKETKKPTKNRLISGRKCRACKGRRHVELPAAHGMRCKRARCSCGRRVWLSCDQPPALILPADWHRADTAVRRPRDTEMNRGYRKEEWRKEVP
ncbi:hypothetical protein RRG08_056286 [Elysia crispata]|uniref:Uncharacterized protein n=1 Tax=Elysia crispata TaxID=231223 RepID=A0AAE1E6D4_9GAST|nr:hypothetical protein RRG08_056286 [Elysia crispata]